MKKNQVRNRVRFKSKRSFVLASTTAVALVFFSCAWSGCKKSNVAEGQSRNKGVRVDQPDVIEESFVHPDHFLVTELNVERLSSNVNFAEFPWQSMVRIPGQRLSDSLIDMNEVQRVSLIMDGGKMSNLMGMAMSASAGMEESPIDQLTLIEFKKAAGADSVRKWLESQKNYAQDKSDTRLWQDESEKLALFFRNDQQFFIGSIRAVQKVLTDSPMTNLGNKLKQASQSEMRMISDLAVFESMFATFESVVKQLAPQQASQFALFRAIEDIEASIDLKNQRLVDTRINMKDDESAGRLAGLISQNIKELLKQIGGTFSGPPRAELESPVDMKSSALLQKAIKELDPDNYSVELDGSAVVIGLQRLKNTDELISAISKDIVVWSAFAERVERANKIGKAITAYRKKYDQFPPAGLVAEDSENARAQFNWRVGILPELGYESLYRQFKFDEAWDSPHNQKIAKNIPEEFLVGSGKTDAERGDNSNADPSLLTSLSVTEGKQASYRGGAALNRGEIKDRLKNTLIVVERSSEFDRNWTSPELAVLPEKINEKQFGRADDRFVIGINGEGKTVVLKRKEKAIEAWLTAAGKEKIDRSMSFSGIPN